LVISRSTLSCKGSLHPLTAMSDPELIHRIALSMLKGIGPISARELVAYAGGVDALFTDPLIDRKILDVPRVGPELLATIKDRTILEAAKRELEFTRKHQIRILFYQDNAYPRRLKHCADAPVVLYVQGQANVNPDKCIAIVGTRKATNYGKAVCDEFVAGLKGTGVLVLSGLAYGIDIHAHRAALKNELPTLAAVAHGLDRLYPNEHAATASRMQERGGLITELASGSKFHPGNFPARNRIVAGMSDCTLVIESGVKGGSLITADIANSYNRDVFAIPGRIDAKYSVGCNDLIRLNRAALVNSPEELISVMGWEQQASKPVQSALFVDLDPEQETLVNTLRNSGALTIDELCVQSAIPQSKAAGLLLDLEFNGVVQSLPGKVYTLN